MNEITKEEIDRMCETCTEEENLLTVGTVICVATVNTETDEVGVLLCTEVIDSYETVYQRGIIIPGYLIEMGLADNMIRAYEQAKKDRAGEVH